MLRVSGSFEGFPPVPVRLVRHDQVDPALPQKSCCRSNHDVCLAGHTHGGQVCWPDGSPLFGQDTLSPAQCTGVHRINGTWMIVNRGIGAALMRRALREARRLGHGAVLLVGDAPYYGRFGFSAEKTGALWLPGPYARDRLLARELVAGALDGAHGLVSPTGRSAKAFPPPRNLQAA